MVVSLIGVRSCVTFTGLMGDIHVQSVLLWNVDPPIHKQICAGMLRALDMRQVQRA